VKLADGVLPFSLQSKNDILHAINQSFIRQVLQVNQISFRTATQFHIMQHACSIINTWIILSEIDEAMNE
jgi:hypothetical protein